jgi:hypothetical protein
VTSVVQRASDLLAWLLLSPWVGGSVDLALGAMSLLAAVLILFAFRIAGQSQQIVAARRLIVARMLELLFLRHDPKASLRAGARVVSANLRYIRALLLPTLASGLLLAPLLAGMPNWFAQRPFVVGEPIVVEIRMTGDWDQLAPASAKPLTLEVPSEVLTLELGPIRFFEGREVCYRLMAHSAGSPRLTVTDDRHRYEIPLAVGAGLQPTPLVWSADALRVPSPPSAARPGDEVNIISQQIDEVRIYYPARQFTCWEWDLNWIWPSVGLTMLFSLLLSRWMRTAIF